MAAEFDETDRTIIRELQADGRMTNVELARRLGMSAPPSLRRVRALEDDGVITGYRALVDEKRLGFEIVFFAFVHLASQAEADLASFRAQMREWPAIRECWTLSGDIDFVLKGVATDLRAFQAIVADLTALPNVRTIRTAIALDKVKDEPIAPV